MNVDITLPRLVGTRESAKELFANAVSRESSVDRLVLRARAVLNAAPSFVDELVKLVGDHQIVEIKLVGESPELLAQFAKAAARRNGTVTVTSSTHALV